MPRRPCGPDNCAAVEELEPGSSSRCCSRRTAGGRAFAGDDVLVAKYYPEDREFLLEFEPHVVHYDVAAQAP